MAKLEVCKVTSKIGVPFMHAHCTTIKVCFYYFSIGTYLSDQSSEEKVYAYLFSLVFGKYLGTFFYFITRHMENINN